MEDKELRLKMIIGFGETDNGIPMTLFYYADKVHTNEDEKFDIDSVAIDQIIRNGYGKYFTFEDLCEVADKKTTTMRRIIKKMKEKDMLKEQVLKEKGKKVKKIYCVNEDIYGIEQTKRLYGTDEFYTRSKFAAETDERNFIEGYPKPRNGNDYYYNENLQ